MKDIGKIKLNKSVTYQAEYIYINQVREMKKKILRHRKDLLKGDYLVDDRTTNVVDCFDSIYSNPLKENEYSV